MRLPFGAPRLKTVLLLGSICLNVLLVAFFATHWMQRLRLPLAADGPKRLVEFVANRMPAADRDVLWRVYRSKEAAITKAQADYRSALLAAGDVLSREPLDHSELRRAVDEARVKRIAVGDLAIDVFIETFPQISPDTRRDLVGRIRRN